MSKPTKDTEPKDGFDLIEYPCEFNFKAMCRSDESLPSIDYVRQIIEPLIDSKDLVSMNTNSSRTGKFESVTALIRINSREQLEMIYENISSAERVVMTL